MGTPLDLPKPASAFPFGFSVIGLILHKSSHMFELQNQWRLSCVGKFILSKLNKRFNSMVMYIQT
jgi:hypothetical protein